MGQMMGKMDPNATNTVDQQGNVVATGTPGGRVVADPNQGLSGGQIFTRRALSGSLQGLAQGLRNAPQRSYPEQQPIPRPMQTPNDFPYPGAQQPRSFPQPKPVIGADQVQRLPDDFPYPGTKTSRVPNPDDNIGPIPSPDSIYGTGIGATGNNPFLQGRPNPFTIFYGR